MRQESRWKDAFGIVLAMLIVSFLVIAILGEENLGSEIAVLIQAIAVLITYRAAGVQGRRFVLVAAAAGIAILGTGVAGVFGGEPARLVSGVSLLVLLAMLPAVIFGRFRSFTRIDIRTVYAALCIYLIIGMFFSVLYQLVDALTAEQFFAQITEPTAMSTLYFSFTTLTTLGYGDISPMTELGQTLAITEALIGQVYLVTVVALIVANLGREKQSNTSDSTADESEAGRTSMQQ